MPLQLSHEETRRWLYLRAVEWANWPAFVSQAIAPLLLVFYPWFSVVAGIFIINALWSLIRYSFTSANLANAACIAVSRIKWFEAIACSIYLFSHQNYIPATLALLWPVLAGLIYFGGMVGRIELNFAKEIGYVIDTNSD